MTHLGSGIWSYSRRSTGAIFLVTVPATIIRSDCRGDARKTSAPNRAMSYRDADAAIISIAQHARPNPIGQIDDSRAQFNMRSMLVVMKLSSNRWSMSPTRYPHINAKHVVGDCVNWRAGELNQSRSTATLQ